MNKFELGKWYTVEEIDDNIIVGGEKVKPVIFYSGDRSLGFDWKGELVYKFNMSYSSTKNQKWREATLEEVKNALRRASGIKNKKDRKEAVKTPSKSKREKAVETFLNRLNEIVEESEENEVAIVKKTIFQVLCILDGCNNDDNYTLKVNGTKIKASLHEQF